ncbi:MAG: M81 family metallopeptidase [Elsteraceae bacterium]
MSQRILLAGLYHETHSFLDEITRAESTRVRRGQELLDRRGDGSTVDGFLSVAERRGWSVVPTLETIATPSGKIDHAVFESFWRELAAAAQGPFDGVWLALHGAMVTTRSLDPEGELLERLRGLPNLTNTPIFGVFDLHATFTQRMAKFADALVGYRENPHTDAFEAAARSAEFLGRALDERLRPRMVNRNFPIVWPPTGTGTADLPMRALCERARAIEAADRSIWAVNIVAGYAFADTPETGASASLVTTGQDADADRYLAELAEIADALKEAGTPGEWALEAAIDDALARKLTGPVLLVETADNIGGGAPGDCTSVLRCLLKRGLDRAAVVINDPGVARILKQVAIGDRLRLPIGGKQSRLDPGPIDLEIELLSRSDGRFTLEDRNSHLAAMQGVEIDMGDCATVRAGGVTILLTSRKTPPFDLGQLRSQGIIPEEMAFIGVKAAVAHRRAYEKIAAASYWVTTPGPCPSDLTTLPYVHIRRPIFPLDPPHLERTAP